MGSNLIGFAFINLASNMLSTFTGSYSGYYYVCYDIRVDSETSIVTLYHEYNTAQSAYDFFMDVQT